MSTAATTTTTAAEAAAQTTYAAAAVINLISAGLLALGTLHHRLGSGGAVVGDGREDRVLALVLAAEHLVELLADADEGSAAGKLLQLAGAHVGAGRANAAQDVADGVRHGAL
jgi:hypothetical protein